MKKFGYCLLLILMCFACEKEVKVAAEIEQIDIDVVLERFDTFFIGPESLKLSELKEAYPFMFSKNFSNAHWIERRKDTLQNLLHSEVDKAFNTYDVEDIISLFKHLKHYLPVFKTPRVITVTSDVDYRNKVIVTDSITLIALDTYLGENHEFYGNMQQYLAQNFKKDMIISDLAEAYAKREIYQISQKSFLDNMIYFGKILYFKDKVIPLSSDAIKIGYTEEQLDWAKANETNIWEYFIERELLYSSDPKLANRFINPAPFSKFELEFDNESPGRLGQYIGWQIVRAYMANNDTSLLDMLRTNPKEIFNNARFKPRK